MACSRCVINTEFWRIIWVSWDIGALLNKTPPKRDGKTYDIVSWRWFAFQARLQYLGRHCLFIFDSFRKNEAKPCIKKAWQFLFIGITFYAFSPFMLALPFNQSYLKAVHLWGGNPDKWCKNGQIPQKWTNSRKNGQIHAKMDKLINSRQIKVSFVRISAPLSGFAQICPFFPSSIRAEVSTFKKYPWKETWIHK